MSRRLNHLFGHKQNSGRGVRKELVSTAFCIWGELIRWFYLLLDKRFVAISCHQRKLFFRFRLASILVFLYCFKFMKNLQIAPVETLKFLLLLTHFFFLKKKPVSPILIYLEYPTKLELNETPQGQFISSWLFTLLSFI